MNIAHMRDPIAAASTAEYLALSDPAARADAATAANLRKELRHVRRRQR